MSRALYRVSGCMLTCSPVIFTDEDKRSFAADPVRAAEFRATMEDLMNVRGRSDYSRRTEANQRFFLS